MAADEPGSGGAREAAAPYVGLRPFRRDERHLFFGRDRDATVLCDKILGARLTLFYAQSGLGKSSLLRALAAPQLEAEDCLVVYHDAWTGERPAEALGAAIAAAAKLPGPGGSLVETARTAAAASGRTLVLLLDQFEEFLIAHAQDLDPLRAELGALVRARDADLRVVLALREELLAALDPFRQAVPELYQSTCRLEPLAAAAVREAIVRPAQLAGGSVAPALVETLVRDLRAGETEAAGAARDPSAADAVDLPMLQLVCRELWNEGTKASRGGEVALTEALYRATGGARAVLDRYVVAVMPRARGDRLVTARLLRLLAPPSGYKISYTLDDLVASSGLPADAVKSAIRRLRGADIVRERMVGRAARYELLHDALIRVLGPWRDEVLRAARVRRWAWRAAAAVAGLALLGTAGAALVEWRDRGQAEREFERNTRGALAQLAAMEPGEREQRAESTFNFVTSYVIWQRGNSAGFASLRRLLQDNAGQLPYRYGEAVTPAPGRLPERWPVVVRHAEGRRLDAAEFQAAWRAHATTMASSWGVPVPMRVEVRADNALPREDVSVRFGAEPPFVVGPLPAYEELYVVSGRGLSGAAERFVDLFAEDWRPLAQIENAGPWYAVPRWSLPVWRSSGAAVESGSRLPALSIFLALQKKPRPLVTPEAVEVLLERAAKLYPRTVAEARAARGARLADDIAGLVRLGRSLIGLPMILDEVADRPGDDPDEVARSVEAALTAAWPDPPPVLHGAWPKKEEDQSRDDLDPDLLDAYREAEPWLPEVDDLIRVEIGAALDPLWLRDRAAFHPDFLEVRETLRERLFARYGFVLPGIFVRYGVLTSPESFRIEVLNQTDRDDEARPIATSAADSLRRFSEEMAMRGAAFRVRWITAETAADSVALLDQHMRAWIAARHSMTDVKNLLRGAVEEDAEARAGQSLPPQALLLSLPYWRARHGGTDAAALSAGLARLRVVAGPTAAATSPDIERGLDFLFDDDPDAAEAWFPTASDPARGAAADAAFVAGFQRRWVRRLEERLRARCVAPYEAALNQEERVALIRRVAAPDPAATGDDGRRAALCLLAEFGRQNRRARELALLAAIDANHADLRRWPDTEVEWLVRRIVERYDPLADGQQPTGHAARLLARLAATGEPARHAETLSRVLEVCRKPGPRNWCWALADGFVAHERASPYAALDLAIELADSQHREDIRQAMVLADSTPARVESARAWLEAGEPERLATFVPYVHARAASALARYHDDAEADARAQSLLARIAAMKDRGDEIKGIAIRLHRTRGRWDEADAALGAALRSAPGDKYFQHERLWLAIARGDRGGTDRSLTALDAVDAATLEGYGFTTALAATLLGRDDWEQRLRRVIAADDRDADYVLMILSAFKAEQLRDEAQFQLDRRATRMSRASWPARLRAGDATAWHEMLIAFVRGEVARAEVFAALADDAAFARSDFAGLRMPRRALLCEAHFYDAMRARMAGDRAGMEAALRATVAVGYRSYLEDSMARYLLARPPAR